jgi:hypothetical protein
MHKKSPAAFKHNIKAEMHAGKPQKQAVAIAYSEKRRAEHKRMAHGGEIEDCPNCYDDGGQVTPTPSLDPVKAKTMSDQFNKPNTADGIWSAVKKGFSSNYAEGGEVKDEKPKPTGTTEMYSLKGKQTPVGMMQREKDLKDYKKMPGPKLQGLAEGGEVEESGDDDHEIHEALGKDLMDAFDKKDHKRIMDGLEACVLSCMNKNRSES